MYNADGIVWRAFDKKTKDIVAVKKIFDAFQNSTDAQRTYREVMFLQEMKGYEHIVSLLNVMKADNDRDLYLVFEHMETDLHAAIRHNILQDVHKQYIMWQLLKTLKFMHSANLLHRDMKPSNLLLNSDCLMKVADFGLARSIKPAPEEGEDMSAMVLTDYIATRWYRAPEILLGSNKYSTAIDMWGAGCILGEILAGKPVFAGSNTMQQLELIAGLVGVPDHETCRHISEYAPTMLDNMMVGEPPGPREWDERFPGASGFALEMLKRLLAFDPRTRISAADALKSEYVKQFHDEWVERNAPVVVQIAIPDQTRKGIPQYRECLYKQAAAFRREEKAAEQAAAPGLHNHKRSGRSPTGGGSSQLRSHSSGAGAWARPANGTLPSTRPDGANAPRGRSVGSPEVAVA